jgi:hypothetical protein
MSDVLSVVIIVAVLAGAVWLMLRVQRREKREQAEMDRAVADVLPPRHPELLEPGSYTTAPPQGAPSKLQVDSEGHVYYSDKPKP